MICMYMFWNLPVKPMTYLIPSRSSVWRIPEVYTTDEDAICIYWRNRNAQIVVSLPTITDTI